MAVVLIGAVIYFNKTLKDSGNNESPKSTLDLSSPYVQANKEVFVNEFAKEANYEGHFRVFDVACGEECYAVYAVDKNSGKVYRVGQKTDSHSVIDNDKITLSAGAGAKFIFIYNIDDDSFELKNLEDYQGI